MLHNESAVDRCDIEVRWPRPPTPSRLRRPAASARETYEQVAVAVPVTRRGVSRWNQFELRTRYPFGWFRAWTYVQAPAHRVRGAGAARRAAPAVGRGGSRTRGARRAARR